MSISLDKTLLEEVALVKVGINEAFIEKDWFVTKVIKVLSENQYLDFLIVFTGGTCLSKAHKLIERFSEDVDFRVIAPSLEGEFSKVRKVLSNFKKHIFDLLEKDFQILKVDAKNGNRHVVFNLAYPSICDPAEVLRPHIKLELTLSNLLLPSIELPVSSFINEVTQQAPEVERIACIHPVENAADKLSAMVWRIPSRVRGVEDKQPDVVRHLHDLAKLSERVSMSPDFNNLARETIERDAKRSTTLTGFSTTEKLSKLMSILKTDPKYPQEYQAYVKEMSYNQDTPFLSFEVALKKLSFMVAQVVPD